VLAQVIQSLRELIPPELQRRVTEALRELLLALRALIDWYLERVERRRAEPAEVQDIPIL
jgi:predicted lipid carrier protein YhbT